MDIHEYGRLIINPCTYTWRLGEVMSRAFLGKYKDILISAQRDLVKSILMQVAFPTWI